MTFLTLPRRPTPMPPPQTPMKAHYSPSTPSEVHGCANDAQKAVLALMQDGRWRTVTDIATACRIKKGEATQAAAALTRSGQLRTERDRECHVRMYVKS